MDMNEEMREALAEYGATIKCSGWKAGDALIEAGEKKWPEFRRWAYALGIVLRANEILEDAK